VKSIHHFFTTDFTENTGENTEEISTQRRKDAKGERNSRSVETLQSVVKLCVLCAIFAAFAFKKKLWRSKIHELLKHSSSCE
jgi:adenylate kinase